MDKIKQILKTIINWLYYGWIAFIVGTIATIAIMSVINPNSLEKTINNPNKSNPNSEQAIDMNKQTSEVLTTSDIPPKYHNSLNSYLAGSKTVWNKKKQTTDITLNETETKKLKSKINGQSSKLLKSDLAHMAKYQKNFDIEYSRYKNIRVLDPKTHNVLIQIKHSKLTLFNK